MLGAAPASMAPMNSNVPPGLILPAALRATSRREQQAVVERPRAAALPPCPGGARNAAFRR